MRVLHLSYLSTLALAAPALESLDVRAAPKPPINATLEYRTTCKTCPYKLCTNVQSPWYGDLTLTCWTEGDLIGDTTLWLKTIDDCYVTEYDLLELQDLRERLDYCGRIPKRITKQRAKIRYLSEGKWGSNKYNYNVKYYGRDQPLTLTCWSEGEDIVGNPYWYKTTDDCYVSGSGLWRTPDRSKLDNCGPDPPPLINETRKRDADDFAADHADEDDEPSLSLTRRWLQPEQIGEEYSPCYKCLRPEDPACRVIKTYEYNDTVTSQCYSNVEFWYPNNTLSRTSWVLTTDWCYTPVLNFWEPPNDFYRYPRCENWEGWD